MRGRTPSLPGSASRVTTPRLFFLTRIPPRCTRSDRRGCGAGNSGRIPKRWAMLPSRLRGFVGVERSDGKPNGPAGPTAHRASSPQFAAPPVAITGGANPNNSYPRSQADCRSQPAPAPPRPLPCAGPSWRPRRCDDIAAWRQGGPRHRLRRMRLKLLVQ